MITEKQIKYLKHLILRGYFILDLNEELDDLLNSVVTWHFDLDKAFDEDKFIFHEDKLKELDSNQARALISEIKKQIDEHNKTVDWLMNFHAEYYDKYKDSQLLKELLGKHPLKTLGDVYHTYYYYAFEGEEEPYTMSLDTFLKNFDILDHEEEIRRTMKTEDMDLWEAINDFCMHNEIFGGDPIFSYQYEI